MLHLSKLDHTILGALATKVRAFAPNQLAQPLWGGNPQSCNRRLRQLASAGLIVEQKLVVRLIPMTGRSIASWKPGAPAPRFNHLSCTLKRRWQTAPTRLTALFVGSRKMCRLIGGRGGGRLTHPLQASHELAVSAVFLNLFKNSPNDAERWIGEDAWPRSYHSQQIPDAVIAEERGAIRLAIEIGGLYSAQRLRRFHGYCELGGIPYEIH